MAGHRRRGALSAPQSSTSASAFDRRRFLVAAAVLPFAGLAAACTGDRADSSDGRRVPEPEGVLRTRWADDPFARGAYSYVPLGVTDGAAMRRRLGAPIDRQLFFAGEATSVDAPATVHGAIASGRRAAGEVLASGAAPDAQIVVLGAGAAGLAAAAELRDAGLRPVVVEARDRVGGRVHTDRSLGVPVDLGAAWVHDARQGNPVLPLARQAAVTLASFEQTSVVRRSGGRTVDADRLFDRTEQAMARVGESGAAEGELDAALRAELGRLGVREPDLSYAVTSYVELQLGAPATEVSWRSFDEGNSEEADALPATGFDAVLAPLAEGLDLRLSTVIASVLWSRARPRLVTTAGEELPFDRCIVTLPLGVLQAASPSFDPPLPASTTAAIQSLGMGLLDKLVLRFPDVFWDRDVNWLGFTGTTPGEWAEFVNLRPATGAPILVGLNAGTTARSFSARADEQVLASAMSALRAMYA